MMDTSIESDQNLYINSKSCMIKASGKSLYSSDGIIKYTTLDKYRDICQNKACINGDMMAHVCKH